MKDLLFTSRLAILSTLIASLALACAGIAPEKGAPDKLAAVRDDELVASLRQQIDDQTTYDDAMMDIERVRDRIVKWRGDIVSIWDDQLLIASRNKDGGWNHFILLLDHPLPEALTIRDLTQTVSPKDAIWAIGQIADRRTVVLDSGTDLIIPHLKCYVISKENDRDFANPVWTRQK